MNKLVWWYNQKPTTKENIINCVGEGWHQLVSDLIDDLFALGWDGNVAQVKEKFGGLRFYIGAGNDAIWDRVHLAEENSYKICEVCGKPGILRESGWYKTLCDEHAKERGYVD